MKQEKLSWEAITRNYPNQWVSLVDIEKDAQGEIRSAIVTATGPDLKVVTQCLKANHATSDRFEYTGTVKRFLGFSKWDIQDIVHAAPTA